MDGWSWALYHRDSRQAIIALGVTGDEERARLLVETADTVAGEIAGVGVVVSPVGEHHVLHRVARGYAWHPMFSWEEPAREVRGHGQARPGIPAAREALP